MGRNFKILLFIFCFIVVYGIYYWGIPCFLNTSKRVAYIEELVFKQTGMKLKLDNPEFKMDYIPAVILSADGIRILNADNSYALDIENPEINIRLLPLIFKQLDIHKFYARKIDFNLIFDGSFRLGDYDIVNLPKSDLKLYHASVNLDDYNLYLDDRLKSQKFLFDGEYLTINDFTSDKHIDLSTIANCVTGSKKMSFKSELDVKLPINNITNNQFNISGHVVNFDLADFSTYINKLSNNAIKSATGLINIVADTKKTYDKHSEVNLYVSLEDFGLFKEVSNLSVYSKGKLELNTNFMTVSSGMDIKNLKLSGDGVNLFASGQINKLNSKLPHLNLKVGVIKSKAEKIIALLPPLHDLTPDIDLYLLKEAGFWGDASGYLEIKGKADYPNVFGNVLVQNAYMVKPILNSDKATIRLGFKGDKFDLDVRVPTSPTQTVWVKGPINLDKDKTADLHITSTDNVDLKTAQIVLNPLHRILHFDLGPVPIMDIKGRGGINLRVVGTQKNPHAWGVFFFRDAIVSFLDIHNLEIIKGSGALNFDNQNTLFKSNTAELNGQPINIKGTCNLFGELNFDVSSNNQDMAKLLKSVKESPMLKDIQDLIADIEDISGKANVNLNLKGQVKDVNEILFNKNLFAKGKLELLSDSVKFKDIPLKISKIAGIINFNNLNVDFNFISNIINSQIKVNGKINGENCDAQIVSQKFNVGDMLRALSDDVPFEKDLSSLNAGFIAKYSGNMKKINYDKINIKGKLYSNKGSSDSLVLDNSDFELNNSNLKLPRFNGLFNGSPFNLNLNISKLFLDNRVINGNGKISNFDLKQLNSKDFKRIFPETLRDIEFKDGIVTLSARAKNNNFNVYTEFDDIKLEYIPLDTNITLNSGNVLLHNTTVNLNKISADIDGMPLFIEGKVYNVQKAPNLDLYLNLKPNQEFFDKFINAKSIYPLKLKGDLILTSKLNGLLNNINAKSTIDIKENSNLYYMGATIGDNVNPVKITLDGNYMTDKIKINNLRYDTIILSQNNKPFVNTKLNASGTINILPNDVIGFNNFRIKTNNPTDAKVFNIIFGKPFLKQGVFTSNLLLNGTSMYPKILGVLNITSIDIPFLDSLIRDISLDFKPDRIYISSKGTVLTNDVGIDAVMKNKLEPPYVVNDFKLKLADLNVNKILDAINDLEAESARRVSVSPQGEIFDIKQLIIKKGEILADKIQVRNIDAKNFNADFKFTDNHIFNINKFKFDMADGVVSGSMNYNLVNTDADINIGLSNANAAIMSEAMFDLKGQIYGFINGNFNLACNYGTDCFKTLSGAGNFNIQDGRMPKLGSLEYLLKASNLLKGGFTGLSINSIIDLVTPLKTGDFDSIYGNINITKGVADDINIYSSGKDLNMYMKGQYNITTSVADMKLFGSISKNITSVFGKLKNVSLNTLLNTIPFVNDNREKLLLQEDIGKIPNIKDADIFKVFTVDVNGDINGNNYVNSFRWVK